MNPHHPGIGDLSLPNVSPSWDRLRADHGGWLGRMPHDAPVYQLAEPIIARLERSIPRRAPILDRTAARAERAFLDLCRGCGAVGFLEGAPIAYPFLSPPAPLPSDDEMIAVGWAPIVLRELRQSAGRAADAADRLKGYAGWLLTEPTFLEDCRDLQGRWAALRPGLRPRFPLERGSFHHEFPEGRRPGTTDADGAAFGAAFFRFCERWGLLRMAAWDLPHPQGALLPDPLPIGSPAAPPQGLRLYLPLHYHLSGDEQLLAQILREQRDLAARAGLPASAAGLPHFRTYARLLEVLHWERAISSRLDEGRIPRGWVAEIKDAIARTIHVSVERVAKCRRTISACRRGRRDSIPELRFKA